MRRGRQLRLRSGTLLPWTTPPYGYRSAPDCPRDPTGVRVELIEGALVQELFIRYLEPEGTLLGLQVSAGVRCAIAARQSTLERGVVARDSDQSRVYG